MVLPVEASFAMASRGYTVHSKLLHSDKGQRTYALIFETGDEVLSILQKFAAQERLTAAQFSAIGAFQRAVISYFDWEKKKYLPIAVDRQVEVITLVGDMVKDEKGKTSLHAHAVLGLPDGTTRGGHLQAGSVRPTWAM